MKQMFVYFFLTSKSVQASGSLFVGLSSTGTHSILSICHPQHMTASSSWSKIVASAMCTFHTPEQKQGIAGNIFLSSQNPVQTVSVLTLCSSFGQHETLGHIQCRKAKNIRFLSLCATGQLNSHNYKRKQWIWQYYGSIYLNYSSNSLFPQM